MALLPQSIADQTTRDHLPRQATADDQSLHILYWDGIVRSMEASAWLVQRGALPTEPTQADSDAAVAAQETARVQALADAVQLRQRVVILAQSAVGVRVDALTAAQVRSLIALVLWKAGALDRTGAVRPPADWIDGSTP